MKGVSSMQLHRDLGISQPAAWFLLHRIREAFRDLAVAFEGPVDRDESCIDRLEGNKHESDKQKADRGPVGQAALVEAKDRADNRVTPA